MALDPRIMAVWALKLEGSSRVNVNPQHGIRITNISLDFSSVPLSSDRTVVTLETGQLPEWNDASKDSTAVKTNVIVLGSLMPERVEHLITNLTLECCRPYVFTVNGANGVCLSDNLVDTIYRNHIHAGEVPRRIHEQPKSMNPAANKINTQDAGQIFQSPSTSTQSSATPVPLQVPQGAVAPANGGPLFGAQSPSKSNGNPYQYVATRPPHDRIESGYRGFPKPSTTMKPIANNGDPKDTGLIPQPPSASSQRPVTPQVPQGAFPLANGGSVPGGPLPQSVPTVNPYHYAAIHPPTGDRGIDNTHGDQFQRYLEPFPQRTMEPFPQRTVVPVPQALQGSIPPMGGNPMAGALSNVTPHIDNSHHGSFHPPKTLKRRADPIENGRRSHRDNTSLGDSQREPLATSRLMDFRSPQQHLIPFNFKPMDNAHGGAPAFGALHNTAPSMPEGTSISATTYNKGIGSSTVTVGSIVEIVWYLVHAGERYGKCHGTYTLGKNLPNVPGLAEGIIGMRLHEEREIRVPSWMSQHPSGEDTSIECRLFMLDNSGIVSIQGQRV
ncbi:hypothetical protein PC9H_005785 [Pleurotus ostreatus]|uniref:Nucleoplasmin-like domain-containing protein n=1 Tax=Pleurotus ostreatus TaxID=5322 RepID=A0A8H7A0K1_PLEOS|nr:uncharacterized protein PC9H_005785 [Pleurotus ostreatus]KAF7433819.1 hypothetical protein PC9H_005785 [Pleurotus ostreatus]